MHVATGNRGYLWYLGKLALRKKWFHDIIISINNEFVGPFLSCGGDSWWNYIMQVRKL